MTPTDKTYQIVSVLDFLHVPADRRGMCLKEFSVWLSLIENAKVIIGGVAEVQAPECFEWIDDDLHHAALIVSDGQESTTMVSGTMRGFE